MSVPLCTVPLGDGVRSTASGGSSAALISAPALLSSTGAEPGSTRAPHQPPWEQNVGPCALGHSDMGEGQLRPNGCRAASPALSAHTHKAHNIPQPSSQRLPLLCSTELAEPQSVGVEGPSDVTLCCCPALRSAALAVPVLLGLLGSGWQPAPLAHKAPDEALLSHIITSVGDAYKPINKRVMTGVLSDAVQCI